VPEHALAVPGGSQFNGACQTFTGRETAMMTTEHAGTAASADHGMQDEEAPWQPLA